ncbi:MAG: hypothetical protein PHT33_08070 [bacterium]|nr:hypothetical protein [bacterium]
MKKVLAVWVLLALLVTALPMVLLADGIKIGDKDVKKQGIAVDAQHRDGDHDRDRDRDKKDGDGFWPGVIGGFIIGSIVNNQNKATRYYCNYHRRYHDGRDKCDRPNIRIGERYMTLRISDADVERDMNHDRKANLKKPVKIWLEGDDIRGATFTIKGRRSHQEVKVYSGTPFVRIYPEDYRYGENVSVSISARQGTYDQKDIDLDFTIR